MYFALLTMGSGCLCLTFVYILETLKPTEFQQYPKIREWEVLREMWKTVEPKKSRVDFSEHLWEGKLRVTLCVAGGSAYCKLFTGEMFGRLSRRVLARTGGNSVVVGTTSSQCVPLPREGYSALE